MKVLDAIVRTISGIVIVYWRVWFGEPIDDDRDAKQQSVLGSLPKPSRLAHVIEFCIFIAVMIAGYVSITWWWAILFGAMALLFVSDRGQHAMLAEAYRRLGWWHVLTMSIGSNALNTVIFCTLSFVLGVVMRRLFLP